MTQASSRQFWIRPVAKRHTLGSAALLTGGMLFLGASQYIYWWAPDGAVFFHEGVEGDATIQPNFYVKEVQSQTLSADTERVLRVLLVNRLDCPVTLLGAESGCQPGGCYEALNLPQQVAPRDELWLSIKAHWTETPYKPLKVRLFTNLSLTATVDIEVLPDSVAIY